jgi:hypothetical protein
MQQIAHCDFEPHQPFLLTAYLEKRQNFALLNKSGATLRNLHIRIALLFGPLLQQCDEFDIRIVGAATVHFLGLLNGQLTHIGFVNFRFHPG